jgi:hypothetical protein
MIKSYFSRLHRFSFLILIGTHWLKMYAAFQLFFYLFALYGYIVEVQIDKELPRNNITFTL